MSPGVRRYLAPAVALLVTFVAGGGLFVVIISLYGGSEDEPSGFTAPTATAPRLPATASPSPGLSAPSASPAAPVASPSPPGSVAPERSPTPPVAPPTEGPTALPVADFAGSWRVIDTVDEGQGAGLAFTFFVTIAQSGTVLQGGAPGAISLSGTVAANIATVQFTQPTLGVTGIFIWTMHPDGNASGTFTSSIPNSGTSQLIRLD